MSARRRAILRFERRKLVRVAIDRPDETKAAAKPDALLGKSGPGAAFAGSFPALSKKAFDVASSKAHRATDRMTRQFATPDQSVNRHFRDLQRISQLFDCVKLSDNVGSLSL
jgi:hypothetical protein